MTGAALPPGFVLDPDPVEDFGSQLPAGFVLDPEPQTPDDSALPPGFVLDPEPPAQAQPASYAGMTDAGIYGPEMDRGGVIPKQAPKQTPKPEPTPQQIDQAYQLAEADARTLATDSTLAGAQGVVRQHNGIDFLLDGPDGRPVRLAPMEADAPATAADRPGGVVGAVARGAASGVRSLVSPDTPLTVAGAVESAGRGMLQFLIAPSDEALDVSNIMDRYARQQGVEPTLPTQEFVDELGKPAYIERKAQARIEKRVAEELERNGVAGANGVELTRGILQLGTKLAMMKGVTSKLPGGFARKTSTNWLESWATGAAKTLGQSSKIGALEYATNAGTPEERGKRALTTMLYTATPAVTMGIPSNILAPIGDILANQVISMKMGLYTPAVEQAKQHAKDNGGNWKSHLWQYLTPEMIMDAATNVAFGINTRSATSPYAAMATASVLREAKLAGVDTKPIQAMLDKQMTEAQGQLATARQSGDRNQVNRALDTVQNLQKAVAEESGKPAPAPVVEAPRNDYSGVQPPDEQDAAPRPAVPGAETVVFGTRGQQFAARYMALPRDQIQGSHSGEGFERNPAYPLENTRDYGSTGEREKAIAVRNQFEPLRHLTDAVDAAVGPVMVADVIREDGTPATVRLGGNTRGWAIENMTDPQRQALYELTNARGDRFGLQQPLPSADYELVRHMGQFDLRAPGTRDQLQQVIDALNPSPGKVQNVAKMAAVDAAANIRLENLNTLRMDIGGEDAQAAIYSMIQSKVIDANLRAQLAESPATAQDYMRRVQANAAFKYPQIADFVQTREAAGTALRGMTEQAVPALVQMRQIGMGDLADSISRAFATVVDHYGNHKHISKALKFAAEQQEMDPRYQVASRLATELMRRVETNSKGAVQTDRTLESTAALWERIEDASRQYTTEPDLFGSARTPEEVLSAVLDRASLPAESAPADVARAFGPEPAMAADGSAGSRQRGAQAPKQMPDTTANDLPAFDSDAPLSIRFTPAGQAKALKLPDWQQVRMGGMEHVRPIEMPELLNMAQELGAEVRLSNFRGGKRGHFKATGAGMEIAIDRRLFLDPNQAAKTMAHELGHLQDYFPDGSLKRGNLLGHIAALRGHMKHKFGENGVDVKTIRKELWELSQWWKPVDAATASQNYIKYRQSPAELYADAVSVLYNSPTQLKARAPKFFNEFMRHMEARPEVAREFMRVQELLNTGDMAKVQSREARHVNAYEAARQELARMQEERQGPQGMDKAKRDILDFRRALIDRMAPAKDALDRAKRQGVAEKAVKNAQFLLDELPFVDSPVYNWLYRVSETVSKPLEVAGLTRDKLGLMMKYQRIMNEFYLDKDGMPAGRSVLANPGGETPATARENLLVMAESLGMERMQTLRNAGQAARDAFFEIVKEGVESGTVSRELFERVVVPNKNHYAPFLPLKALSEDKVMHAAIKEQTGMFDETMNEFEALQVKGVLMKRWNQWNQTKRDLLSVLEQTNEATPAKLIGQPGHERPVDPKFGFENLMLMEDGKPKWYTVDKVLAESLHNAHPAVASLGLGFFKSAFREVFYPLHIKYSYKFAARNTFRDMARTVAQLPQQADRVGALPFVHGAARARMLKGMSDTAGDMRAYMRGEMTPLTKELLELKAIVPPTQNLLATMSGGGELKNTLASFGLLPEHKADAITRLIESDALNPIKVGGKRYGVNTIMQGAPWITTANEFWGKAAAYKVYRSLGYAQREAAEAVRNRAGTPNYMKRGTAASDLGTFMHFHNMIVQGMTTDMKGMFAFGKEGQARRNGAGPLVRWGLTSLPYLILFEAARRGGVGRDEEEKEKIQKWANGFSDYAISRFTHIPIGLSEMDKGKAPEHARSVSHSVAIPNDDFVRYMNSAALAAMRDRGVNAKDRASYTTADILKSTVDNWIPPANIMFQIGANWYKHMTRETPRDEFRQQDILSRRGDLMRGSYGLAQMAWWTADRMGLSPVGYFDTRESSNLAEAIVRKTPGLNGLIMSSNGGHYANDRQFEREYETLRGILIESMHPDSIAAYDEYREMRRREELRELDNNSLFRYMTLQEWHSAFFEPTIDTALNQMSVNGSSVEETVRATKYMRQSVPPPPKFTP